jgi:hypothetical protein
MAISILLRVSGRRYLKYPECWSRDARYRIESRDSIAETGYSKPEVFMRHGTDESMHVSPCQWMDGVRCIR